MKLTFLKPNNPYRTFTCKTFKEGEDGRPVKTSDYSLGKHFDVEVVEIEDIGDLFFELSEHSNGWIRIAGEPRPSLPSTQVQRTLENFPETESCVLMLDLDKWDARKVNWDFRNHRSLHKAVKELLTQEGFAVLTDAQFVCLQTASQFSSERLSCHLYFILDRPISLPALREWCNALKKVRGRAIFDPATQRSVQPDYISRRRCEDFDDPLPETARLSRCKTGSPVLAYAQLEQQISQDLAAAGWQPGQDHRTKLGVHWLETLDLCGVEGQGVNEVCFRAAAQLVHEMGRSAVQVRLSSLAQEMHARAWKALEVNDPWSGQGRDRKADMETYTIARFQQYLSSASTKSFSASADEMKKVVEDAIEKAKIGAIAGMYDRPVVDAYMKLKVAHTGIYAELKARVKKELRGSLSITDYEKSAAGEAARQGEEGGVFGEGDNAFIARVLGEFDWLEDENGVKYAGWGSSHDNRYRIGTLDVDLSWAFYAKGMELSGGTVSPMFGKTTMQALVGREVLSRGGTQSLFQPAQIGVRVYPEGGAYSKDRLTWINLGKQPNGQYLCAKITVHSVEIISESICPVKWRDGENAAPLVIPTDEERERRFKTLPELMDWTRNRLFDFIPVQADERPLLLGMIFALLSGRGTSPIIEFVGPASAGKSTAADLLMDLIDPIKGGLSAGGGRGDLPSIKRGDLINVVACRYLSVFDNVSKLTRDMQDMLCQIATGTSKDHRVMYVGTFVRVFAKRPILLTALESVITRPDAESRRQAFHFHARLGFIIPPHDLYSEWEKDKPFLFLGLLHLLSEVVGEVESTKVKDGVDARRIWYDLADRYFYTTPEEIAWIRRNRRFEASKSLLESSEFALGIAAWLQSRERAGIEDMDDSSNDLYHDYRDWITSRSGTDVFIETADGAIKWRCNSYKGAVPETVQGFRWDRAKYSNVVREVIGWEITAQQRGSGATGRRVVYKIKDEWEEL